MAITTSAKKEIRASARRRVFNVRCLRLMRSLAKETLLIHKKGDVSLTRAQFSKAQQAIDKAEKRGIIKKRAASRKKAVLSRLINQQS